MTDNVDPTSAELAGVFYSNPFTIAYGFTPPEERPAVSETKPLLPGFILVTPAAEGYKPYLINVASIQTVNPPHESRKDGTGCVISHDAENFESVKESFEEVMLLMAAALS